MKPGAWGNSTRCPAICGPGGADPIEIAATSRISAVDVSTFPPNPEGDIAGWMYLNLDQPGDGGLSAQAWPVVSMVTDGRFSVDFDAPALGNGCSPGAPFTEYQGGSPAIGRAPNEP